MNELENLRCRIDAIDKELITLFEKRMETVHNIAEYKTANNLPVLNQGREDAIISKVSDSIKNKEYLDSATDFIKDIMAISRKYQEKFISEQK